VADPADIVRTPGSESNVKEIYDKCHELDQDPAHVIFNQFCEFGNHLVHYLCTGKALSNIYEHLKGSSPNLNLKAFVSSTGSAGTIAAGDYLKEEHGSWTVAMEALECPTLLHNGFGEHNIQGIGDKHVPYIHNVMSTDFVVAVSDQSTDAIGLLFATDEGKAYLADRKGVDKATIDRLSIFGFSGIANVLGAIKVAKQQDLGADDLILTVATDGAEMYGTENCNHVGERYEGNFDALHAAEVYGQHLAGAATDHVLELSHEDKKRIFNLGYFTWVEQQGVSLEDFVARRDQSYWTGLRSLLSDWDAMIEEFNAETGVLQEL
jgi:cysteine synthase